MKSDVYRSFTAVPYAIINDDGELLDYDTAMRQLAADVHLITDLAYWELTEENLAAVPRYTQPQNAEVGRLMGIRVPDEHKIKRKSGNSRFDKLLQDRVVRELKSWAERRNALQGDKRMSAGWRRTVNGGRPHHLHPKFSLSATDRGYSKLSVDGSTLTLNGSRLMRVSAYNTSKECHLCGGKLAFTDYRHPTCPSCGITHDRDVNAAANIALRLIESGTHQKCVATRRKAKRYTRTHVKRSRAGTGVPLKHPGRDRTKARPTPKRRKGVKQVLIRCSAPAREEVRRVVLDVRGSNQPRVTVFGSMKNTVTRNYRM